MLKKQLPAIHPGEILFEEFMRPASITKRQLASRLCVPEKRIRRIVSGRESITANIACRLAVYLNMEAMFWLNLQTAYDLRVAERDLLPKIKASIRPLQTESEHE